MALILRSLSYLDSFLMLPESVDYLICTEAVTNITVLAWDRTTIRSLRARYARLADNVALIAYDYLVLYRSLHLAARCDTAPQRFALVLANLATGIGRQVDGGFELDVRNEELANEAGVTIFTASRLMSRWALEGIIAKDRGKVVVLSLAALYSLADRPLKKTQRQLVTLFIVAALRQADFR
jgi:CRP-like cAMP-binding protein